jgi:hypothetical protein
MQRRQAVFALAGPDDVPWGMLPCVFLVWQGEPAAARDLRRNAGEVHAPTSGRRISPGKTGKKR